ncbi:MAG TPA: carboxymuconolactone decarboxylase family protein [Candidatus Eisenbacteria bacterium]|nr:carboxymuconolactone decarboxylase family protein [Candidatus Eisenbacteria bacterium]
MKKPPLRYRHTAPELDSPLRELEENGALDPPRVRLVLAAAATTQGVPETVRGVLEAVLARGAQVDAVREAVLQSYLFVGYPRVINALAALRDVSGADASTTPPDLRLAADQPSSWEEQGQALCGRIYGRRYAKLLDTMARLSPDLPRWMVLEGYGKVLSRPHLDTKTRELVAVGSLVPLRVPEQLRAHSRGALNVGASPDEVRHALNVAALLCPRESAPALRVLERVLGELDHESF